MKCRRNPRALPWAIIARADGAGTSAGGEDVGDLAFGRDRFGNELADYGLGEIDGQGLQSSLRQGWYYGPERFRDALLTRAATLLQQRTQVHRNYPGPELREHGEQAAQCLLEAGLRRAKLRATD